MATEKEPDWKLTTKRVEDVLADLEAAAAAARTQGRFRPGITALAGEVADLRSAIVGLVQRQIAVGAIWDAALEFSRQGSGESRRTKTFPASFHENIPFSVAEQAQISDQIQRIKTYITTTYELTADQISDIKERLDDAEEASSRLGRKDWLTLFYGAVFSLILAGLIPPQTVQHILLLVLHSIGYQFGLGGPPIPLPLYLILFLSSLEAVLFHMH